MAILSRMGARPPRARPILSTDEVLQLQRAAEEVFVHHAVAHYIVRLVMATRVPHAYGVASIGPLLEYGVSPRGSLGLLAASRALALLRGRDYVLPIDVADIAPDVLAHRLMLRFDAVADGVNPREVIDVVLRSIAPPHVAPRTDDLAEAAS